jgi:DNA polymerase-3 subunit gamma/tau
MLGTIERSYVVDICTALTGGTGTDVLAAISRMAEQAPDYDQALSDVLSIWHQVAILQTVPEALDKGVANYSELLNLATLASKEDVQLFYQICLLGRKDLHLAPDLKSGFEMVMLRALAFRPDANPPVREVPPVSAPQEAESPAKKPEAAAPEAPPPAAAPVATDSEPEPAPEPALAPEPEPELASEPEPQSIAEPTEPVITEPTAQKIALQDFTPDKWIEIRKQLSIGASLGEIASHCLYQGRSGNQLQFLIDSNQTSLYDSAHQQTLAEALSEYFGEAVTVEITFGVPEQETPRAADNREKAERLAAAVETLNSDPSVIKFKQLFDGHLNEQSVRPID